MKKYIIYIFILSSFYTNISVASNSNVGRYQLFQGEYQFINLKGEEFWSKALFKIDTVTGKIYICKSDQILGKYLKRDGEAYQRSYCQDFEQDFQIK